jgi:hypothetical protein
LLQHKLEALSLKKNMVTPGFDSTSLRWCTDEDFAIGWC